MNKFMMSWFLSGEPLYKRMVTFIQEHPDHVVWIQGETDVEPDAQLVIDRWADDGGRV